MAKATAKLAALHDSGRSKRSAHVAPAASPRKWKGREHQAARPPARSELPIAGAVEPQTHTLEDPAALEELAPSWQALSKPYGPTEQLGWATSCLATLDAGRPLRVMTLSRNDQCVALAPMVLRRVRGIRRLALVGVSDLHEPADLLAADDEALRRLSARVVDRREPVVIERMLADSPTLIAMASACRGRAILVCRPAANCPFISLDPSWLEPESHLNSGRRSDLRRARRKAEQAGPVRFEIQNPRPADVDSLFDQALTVEAKSWKGDAGTALAYDGRRAEFFRHYVHQAAREGILRMCFMYIGDTPAAMQIAIEQQQGFWLLKIGYDAGFASASPGLLLMRETIRYATAAGLRTYEFLGRAEAWTTVWTNEERSTVTLRVFPITPRGLAALAIDVLAAGGRKTLGKARAAANRIKALSGKPRPANPRPLSRGPVPLFSAENEPELQGKA